MTATAKTIIVGDEIATGLDKALRALPNTLPLWTAALPGWPITPMIAKGAIHAIKKIEDGWQAGGGSQLPTNIIVSAGRAEALGEPDDASQKDLDELADDTRQVVETLKSAGNVFWLLPPAITGERKARSVIAKAALDAGARVLDGAQYAADPKASRDKPAPADLPSETYAALANVLKAWVPIGPSPFANMVVTADAPASDASIVDRAKGVVSAAAESISGWSTPAKVAGGVIVSGIVVGGVIALSGKPKRARRREDADRE